MTVRHVLLDADGVVQDLPGGWWDAFAPFMAEPEALFARLSLDEQACIRGEGPFLPVLAEHLEALGVTASAQEVYDAVWCNIEIDPHVVALVGRLRASGVGVHLATNQNPERAAYMRAELNHDETFETSFYSCELGLAKPDAEFFTRILDTLHARPDEVAFVDDSERNVLAARDVGMSAAHWHLTHGIDQLRTRLGELGVPAATR